VIIVGSKLEKNKNKLGAQSVVSLHVSVQKDVVEQRPTKKQQDRGSMHKTNVKLKHNFDWLFKISFWPQWPGNVPLSILESWTCLTEKNIDCSGTVQVPAGRHPVRRLPAEGYPRKWTGLRQHFLSRQRVCQNPEDGFGGICVGPNKVPSFAKGQSPSISPLWRCHPNRRVLFTQLTQQWLQVFAICNKISPIAPVQNQQTRELISTRKTWQINTTTKLRVTLGDSGLCCVYMWRPRAVINSLGCCFWKCLRSSCRYGLRTVQSEVTAG